MKILLIYPDSRNELIGWGDMGAIAEPLALEYLGATALERGHEVRILDLRLRPDDLYEELLIFNPDVVGLTGYSMHVMRVLELARETRKFCPNAVTIVGGHHATLLPVDFQEPQIDHVVVGEGVGPFGQLLDQIAGGDPMGKVGSVWSQAPDGSFTHGGPERVWHADELPPPARHLTAADRDQYYIDWMRPIALLRATVGCPFKCSFCSLWKLMDGKYLKRDIEKVVDELAAIKEDYVFLVDDEPFIDVKRMGMLAAAIRARGIKKEYFAYCRIDSFLRSEDLMRCWHDIGLRRLFFGIEAVANDELNAYNKKIEIESVSNALRLAKKIGISVFASFIVKPTYTKKEFAALAKFIRDNEVDYPSFTILTPIPGSDDAGNFESVLFRQPNGRPDWSLFDLQNAVIETTLSREDFMKEYRAMQGLFAHHYAAAGHPYFTKGGIADVAAAPV